MLPVALPVSLYLLNIADLCYRKTSEMFIELISARLRLLIKDAHYPASLIRRSVHSDQDWSAVLR